jgi:hypothetical protein
MSDFIAKARLLMRTNGWSFNRACSYLGEASGRARRARKAKIKADAETRRRGDAERVDWHTRWERERERAEGE